MVKKQNKFNMLGQKENARCWSTPWSFFFEILLNFFFGIYYTNRLSFFAHKILEICFKITPENDILDQFYFFDFENIVFGLSSLHFRINKAKHLIFVVAPKNYNLNNTEEENKGIFF